MPERRRRYTRSGEEEKDASMCPCRKATESRTDIVGECEMHKEDVLEEAMRKIDKCDMTSFGTLLQKIGRKRSLSLYPWR